MLRRTLLNNDLVRIKASLTGQIKLTHKPTGNTSKITQLEARHLLNVLKSLSQLDVPFKVQSPTIAKVLNEFCRATNSKGMERDAFFCLPPDEVAAICLNPPQVAD